MEYRFQYETEEEREYLISVHSDKYLMEVRNVTEGNFLVFSDIKPIQIEIIEMKQRQDATDAVLLQLLLEGMI